MKQETHKRQRACWKVARALRAALATGDYRRASKLARRARAS